jgi:capsular exopolysaccharide synthesis family protein
MHPAPSKKRDDAVAISQEHTNHWPARAVVVDQRGRVSEHYRHFALRVLRAVKERNARTILVTSALRAEGKTTTACNLALALSSLAGGRPVALVDLDLRRPSVGASLGLVADHGLEEVLAGRGELSAACVQTQSGCLDVYPVGRPTRQAHELLASDRFGDVVRELTRMYEYVVFDSPPSLLVPDVPLALAEVDCAVAVARAGVTSKRAFDEMLGVVNEDKLLGVFLNEANAPRHKGQYGYYLDDDGEATT